MTFSTHSSLCLLEIRKQAQQRECLAHLCLQACLNLAVLFHSIRLRNPNTHYTAQVMLPVWRRKWQPTPAFLPGESHGRKSLVATVHSVAESDTTERLHSLVLIPVVRRMDLPCPESYRKKILESNSSSILQDSSDGPLG